MIFEVLVHVVQKLEESRSFRGGETSDCSITQSTANEPGRLGDQSRQMGRIRSRITNDVIERLWSN